MSGLTRASLQSHGGHQCTQTLHKGTQAAEHEHHQCTLTLHNGTRAAEQEPTGSAQLFCDGQAEWRVREEEQTVT